VMATSCSGEKNELKEAESNVREPI
jgi:hypothetical protein